MSRNLALWIIVGLFIVAIFSLFQAPSTQKQQMSIDYSTLMQDAKEGNIQEILISGNKVTGKLKDGNEFSAIISSNDPNLLKNLTESNTRINNARIKFAATEEDVPGLLQIFLSWLPMILLTGIFFVFIYFILTSAKKQKK